MTLLEMYEKISLKTPIEQRKFFNYFDDSVNELMSMYDLVIIDGKTYFVNLDGTEYECVGFEEDGDDVRGYLTKAQAFETILHAWNNREK